MRMSKQQRIEVLRESWFFGGDWPEAERTMPGQELEPYRQNVQHHSALGRRCSDAPRRD